MRDLSAINACKQSMQLLIPHYSTVTVPKHLRGKKLVIQTVKHFTLSFQIQYICVYKAILCFYQWNSRLIRTNYFVTL